MSLPLTLSVCTVRLLFLIVFDYYVFWPELIMFIAPQINLWHYCDVSCLSDYHVDYLLKRYLSHVVLLLDLEHKKYFLDRILYSVYLFS